MPKPKNSCDCDTDPHPFLIFDRDRESLENEKIRSFWKKFHSSKEELQDSFKQNEPLDLKVASQDLEDNDGPKIDEGEDLICEERTYQDDRSSGAKELFEKMLALRIDQHALAIKDGYRIRPQVCVCDDDCCSCFDYTPFLHNLKLHRHKKLLAREYQRMMEARERLAAVNPGIRASASNKQEEGADETSSSGLSESYDSKFAKAGAKQNDPDPPYESRFNSAHGRLREFDPNLYKFHVRKEARKHNDKRAGRPENQTGEPAVRRTWRI